MEKTDFVSLLLKPLGVFLTFLIFVAAIDHLNYPPAWNFKINFLGTDTASVWRCLKLIVLTCFFFWVILRLVDFGTLVYSQRASRMQPSADHQIIFFLRDFVKVIIGIIGFIVVMRFLVGREWTSKMIGALGIGAAALALAAKETIENLIGSFIILLDKPFRMGDYIKVSGITGVVEKVGLRSTRIRSDNKTYVTLPNRQVVDSTLEDITMMTQRRAVLHLELEVSTPADAVLGLLGDIQGVLSADQEVIDNFTLNFNDISRSAYAIQIIYYTQITEWQAFNNLKQRINLRIIQSMESRGIKLALGMGVTL
jgi:MscS family membrane protein